MTIRVRITVWYSVVLAVVLAITGAAGYGILRTQLRRTTDAALAATSRQIVASLRDEAAETHDSLRPQSVAEVLKTFNDRDHPNRVMPGAPGPNGFRTIAHVRYLFNPARIGAKDYVVAAGVSLAEQERILAGLRRTMLLTMPLALLMAACGGYLLARKSLAPVAAMSAKARAIGAANLSERVAAADPRDELGELAATLNDLLARLDASFAAQRRFMADASHELRSPVAILQGELDVTLSRDDRDAADYRESLEVMRRSVQRLTRIVRDLFLLARSDAGEVPLERERTDLDDVVRQTVRAYKTVAGEHGVALAAECDGQLVVSGDEDLLQRMLGNVLENAIRHAPRGSDVDVRCAAAGDDARIEVRDRGAGVPEPLREQIFERFFRVDPARRATAGSGAGLGLPIARWIAEAHGGALRLASSGPDGTVFVVTLPRRAAEPS